MAAPSGTTWGSIVGGYGRIGVCITTSNTNTQTKVNVTTWFWSKYSVSDSSNTYYYTNESTSATTDRGSKSIKTTVDSGDGWSTSNQVKLGEANYTYDRGTSAVTKSCAAKLTGIDKVGGTMKVTDSYTIPALTKYTVTYNANGGSGAPSAQTKYYGKTLTLSSTKPTKSGYTFMGWGTSASDTSVDYNSGGSYTGNSNITLYAIWRKSIVLSFNVNGGSGTIGSGTQYIYNSTTQTTFSLPLDQPTKSGYTFLGWSTSSNATSASYSPGGSITLSSSTTLYAVWSKKITLSYNANSGTGAPSSTSATIYNSTTSYKFTISSTKPTRTGYTFLGWSTSSTATSASYSSGGAITLSSNTTLYAVWKINTYTVSYQANGGSGIPTNQTKTYGIDLKLSTTIPTKVGYTFVGWNTSATATTALYTAGSNYTGNSAITLYAIWKKTITLSYSANNGTNAPGASSATIYNVTTNYKFTVSSNTPTRTGYTFLGWGTSENATTVTYKANDDITLSSSTTLYAVWEIITYTIVYNGNGGSNVPGNQTKTYGVTLKLSNTIPIRSGYKFIGWSVSSDDTEAIYVSGEDFTTNADTTLYAIWEQLGVMHIKVDGTWKQGRVWINQNGKWVTGLVYQKVNGVWKQGGA